MSPKGPTDRAEGCSSSQELEKAHKVGYFSSTIYYYKLIMLGYNKSFSNIYLNTVIFVNMTGEKQSHNHSNVSDGWEQSKKPRKKALLKFINTT